MCESKKQTDSLYKSALQWIENMLLYDEIRLKDVPIEIRTATPTIYVFALRVSNGGSCRRFVKDLSIMCSDIQLLSENHCCRDSLIDTFETYLSINNHKGEDDFEKFKRDIAEDLLQELQQNNRIKSDHLKKQLAERGIVT